MPKRLQTIQPLVLALLFTLLITPACKKKDLPDDLNPKEEMRNFVIDLSVYAKGFQPNFAIIPQNGVELVTQDGNEDGPLHNAYLTAIDGHGQEDLFYGYNQDDQATPSNDRTYLQAFLDRSKDAGNTILVTDYCSTPAYMDDSYAQNLSAGYISFAADDRELRTLPSYPAPIHRENSDNITSLSQTQNFLYLINPESFATKADFIATVANSNYDLILMDLYFHDGTPFSAAEIAQLKTKANGGSRLVVSYMSIGEAEDYRYYWQTDWNQNAPVWLDKENPAWPGNYKVRYWEPEWQAIIFGNDDSYLKKILDAGFDGAYLDIIDGFEHWE